MIDINDPVSVAVEVEKDRIRSNGYDPNIFIASTGVKFRIKAVNRQQLGGVTQRYMKSKPAPPVVYLENKGREEENPDDPDYIEAMQMWTFGMAMAVNSISILRGTEVVESSIPSDMIHWKSEDWKFEVEIMGGDPQSERACYLEWVKAVACNDDDLNKLFSKIGRKSGITQEDVDSAVSQFRR